MDKQVCKHCLVSGRVQGVSFRYYTRQQAQRLNISGWARNLADGRVEVLACGESSRVEQLCTWLHEGPSLARVTAIQCQAVSQKDCPEGFWIG